MLINETFESHQTIPALLCALTWYDEPEIWMYQHRIGRITYIHVANIEPTHINPNYKTECVINVCDESGQFLHARRRITICEGISVSGVTSHVGENRVDRGTIDSNTPV